MNKVTLLLAQHADGNDPFKSSVARALLLSMSSDELNDVVDTGGSIDPFASDKNIQRVLSLGFITKSDLEDPVLLATALAAALAATVDMVAETEVPSSNLNEPEVLKYEKQYTDKFSQMAFLVERYDDELLFRGIGKSEAAGMARALIAVSGQQPDLWMRVAQEGTV